MEDGKINPAGTQYLGLIDTLIDIFKDGDVSKVEVVFISYKLDEKGEKVVEDGQHVAEIRPIGINGIGPEVREELRKQYDATPLMSIMMLSVKDRRLRIQKFNPVPPGTRNVPDNTPMTPWEERAVAFYVKRNIPDEPKS